MDTALAKMYDIEHVTYRQAPRFVLSFLTCTWACQSVQELRLTSGTLNPACDEGLVQMLLTKGVLLNVKRIIFGIIRTSWKRCPQPMAIS